MLAVEAFADELVKLGADYRYSRLLTTPGAQAMRGALADALAGAAEWGVFGAAGGISRPGAVAATTGLAGLRGALGGPGRALAERRNFAQATLARLVDGGRLMGEERARLVEALGVAPERLDRAAARLARGEKNRFMTPAESLQSCLSTTKYLPHLALDRVVNARALAGRVAAGEPLLQAEKNLFSAVRGADRAERLRRALPYAAGGAATGAGVVAAALAQRGQRRRRRRSS